MKELNSDDAYAYSMGLAYRRQGNRDQTIDAFNECYGPKNLQRYGQKKDEEKSK